MPHRSGMSGKVDTSGLFLERALPDVALESNTASSAAGELHHLEGHLLAFARTHWKRHTGPDALD